MLDFYLNHETPFKLNEKYQHQRLNKVLSKYSKHSQSVTEIEDLYKELNKYSKSTPEVTIAEKLKLMPRKRKIQKAATEIKLVTAKKL